MSSIVDSVTSIGEGIASIFSALNPFSENFILKILFDWISDLLYEIFVPDTELINQQFNNTVSNLKGRIGITMYNLDNLFDASAKPTDVTADYKIYGVGTMNLPFANYKYLADGVNFFRPFIRGLLVLLLFIFNVRQLMSMFGLSTGEIIGYSASKEGDKK